MVKAEEPTPPDSDQTRNPSASSPALLRTLPGSKATENSTGAPQWPERTGKKIPLLRKN